jgi:ABC-2 type transport system ATP-binding protein|tara:strand:- start:133 stop:726 length:594 start_codon:yes stop_codon:yes gene_type:complete
MYYLKVKNLTLGYGNDIVIKNLNLSLKFNTNYQIIGRNGAGKSTLLDFISNNFQGNFFDSRIEVERIRILQISNKVTLIENLSLMENCYYFTHEDSISKESISLILEEYEVHHFKDELIQNFSSGMVKRSELALAQIINPEILCIDEPVNYLDNEGIEILKKLLKKRSDNKKSNILSSQESLDVFEDKYEIIDLNVY